MAAFLRLLFFLPVGLLGLAFAVANRHSVLVSFDPFVSEELSGPAITAPLYLIVFLAIILGVILGGVATWITQGRARSQTRAALAEVDRLRKELARASASREGDKPAALFKV